MDFQLGQKISFIGVQRNMVYKQKETVLLRQFICIWDGVWMISFVMPYLILGMMYLVFVMMYLVFEMMYLVFVTIYVSKKISFIDPERWGR